MSSIFAPVDKNLSATEGYPTVTSCYLECFYKLVFKRNSSVLRDCVFECITKERNGEVADREVLQSVVQVKFFDCLAYSIIYLDNWCFLRTVVSSIIYTSTSFYSSIIH